MRASAMIQATSWPEMPWPSKPSWTSVCSSAIQVADVFVADEGGQRAVLGEASLVAIERGDVIDVQGRPPGRDVTRLAVGSSLSHRPALKSWKRRADEVAGSA